MVLNVVVPLSFADVVCVSIVVLVVLHPCLLHCSSCLFVIIADLGDVGNYGVKNNDNELQDRAVHAHDDDGDGYDDDDNDVNDDAPHECDDDEDDGGNASVVDVDHEHDNEGDGDDDGGECDDDDDDDDDDGDDSDDDGGDDDDSSACSVFLRCAGNSHDNDVDACDDEADSDDADGAVLCCSCRYILNPRPPPKPPNLNHKTSTIDQELQAPQAKKPTSAQQTLETHVEPQF